MNPTDTAAPERTARPWRRLAAVLVLSLALWALLKLTGLRSQINPRALRDVFAAHSVWGFIAFTLLFTLANLVHVPGWIFLVAAVVALGPAWGTFVTCSAGVIGCVLIFFIVRALGGNALRELPGPLARRIFATLDAHPIRSVALLRALLMTMPTLNYALALSGLRFRDYLLGTLIGLPLPLAVYATFLDTLASWMGWTLQ